MTAFRLPVVAVSERDGLYQGPDEKGEDQGDKQTVGGIIGGQTSVKGRIRLIFSGKSKDWAGVAGYGLDWCHLPKIGGLIL